MLLASRRIDERCVCVCVCVCGGLPKWLEDREREREKTRTFSCRERGDVESVYVYIRII